MTRMFGPEDVARYIEKEEDAEMLRGKFPPDYYIEKQGETTSRERQLIYDFYGYLLENHCIDITAIWHLEREMEKREKEGK